MVALISIPKHLLSLALRVDPLAHKVGQLFPRFFQARGLVAARRLRLHRVLDRVQPDLELETALGKV